LEANDARRPRLLKDENRKLKRLVADQTLEMMVLKEVLGKKS
jgi:putative transposase